jgi:hypothetical protein
LWPDGVEPTDAPERLPLALGVEELFLSSSDRRQRRERLLLSLCPALERPLDWVAGAGVGATAAGAGAAAGAAATAATAGVVVAGVGAGVDVVVGRRERDRRRPEPLEVERRERVSVRRADVRPRSDAATERTAEMVSPDGVATGWTTSGIRPAAPRAEARCATV